MQSNKLEQYDPKEYILIKGARVHNLKNISLAIPRNKLIVITGLSGSGKSSLAFDTLYAEGQRRYIESLSSYARQFLGKLNKPEVDYIKGISPAIAIEQKVSTSNPRSTVGTSTEIYDYLKLLFARIGKTFSPVSGKEVKRHSVNDVINYVNLLTEGSKVQLFAPSVPKENRYVNEHLEILLKQGFNRLKIHDKLISIEDALNLRDIEPNNIYLLIDRFIIDNQSIDNLSRIADSVQTAFYEGNGNLVMDVIINNTISSVSFSNRFEADDIQFQEPSVHFFSFNNPFGACKTCEGFGSVIGIDEDLVVPDKSLSIHEGAIVCWKGEKMGEYLNDFIKSSAKHDFPIHRPYYQLEDDNIELLWKGSKYFTGLYDFFKMLEENSYKIQYRVMLSRYRGKTTCPDCKGTRLRKDTNYVKINNKSISDLILLPIDELRVFFDTLCLSKHDETIAHRLLIELKNRLKYLDDVGLGYLTLNRLSNTLSGGESQRVNLATSLGSSLVGSMYILDEPSIGLHPRDTLRLLEVLRHLKNLGNTVIVVEHDEEIMQAADQIIDLGPMAGTHGGEIIFQGDHDAILKETESITACYLNGLKNIPIPPIRRKWKNFIQIKKARENNLKSFDVKFPLGVLTVVTGVSGSGKSTLVKKVLYGALKKIKAGYETSGITKDIEGDVNQIKEVEYIDQNPIGRSSRSNPATYVKAYDEIRSLFSSTQLARQHGLKPSHFSFNVDGGRCESCLGEGIVKIEMQFMADIELECDSCKGKRFKEEILEVKYMNKNISDILDFTIDDAIDFFNEKTSSSTKKIVQKIQPLQDVGLGYIKLGQSSSTLSGGEAQRIKLASFLNKGNDGNSNILFIFDEPTTGLHFFDIEKLLTAFNALIEKGHTILTIEHNPDVIKCADWIIDLGPVGGKNGGFLLFEGTPDDIINSEKSVTGLYLKNKVREITNSIIQ